MEVLRTECSLIVKPDADAMHFVRFIGEGGESIDVTLAVTGETGEPGLVHTAAAIMVQVANSVVSNRNDKPSSASAPSSELQRFRFVYRDGDALHEIPEVDFPSMEAARADAIRSAKDLYRDLKNSGHTASGWAVRVYGEKGNLAFEISFEDVQRES